MYGTGVQGAAAPPPRPPPGPPAAPAPAPRPAAPPPFSDVGAATRFELQKPRLPPTQTPFRVVVLPIMIRPSALRGAGSLASRARASCCRCCWVAAVA